MSTSDRMQQGRRGFLGRLGSAAALGSGALTLAAGPAGAADPARTGAGAKAAKAGSKALGAACAAPPSAGNARLDQARALRVAAAERAWKSPMPMAESNGDEARHADFSACFSKGLPHDDDGRVDPAAYRALLGAIEHGRSQDYAAIPVASPHMPLVNPQGGLGYGLLGLDPCQFRLPPAPAFASAERAVEQIELHWMALARDIPFADYAHHPLIRAACEELSRQPAYSGPRANGRVTPELVFRGSCAGDQIGPFVSQFLLQKIRLGALPVTHQISTYLPVAQGGNDYLTDFDSWLSTQNGEMMMAMDSAPGSPQPGELRRDPVLRHVRSGRDLCAYVHTDFTYQAFFNASVWLANHHAPPNPGSPYPLDRSNQTGFATLGVPDAQGMMALAHLYALRAVWYQKWNVHRVLRPEEFGARVHLHKIRRADHPVHALLLESEGLARSFEATRGYLLPQAFPEGCPQHPSYAQGHAACAGACVTVLKAFYDGSTRLMQLGDVFDAAPDGRSLQPYRSVQAGQLTVAGELDKLAGNIAIGRNFAGIHWRSDYLQGLRLGEAVALEILRDCRATYSEQFSNLRIRKFDGDEIAI